MREVNDHQISHAQMASHIRRYSPMKVRSRTQNKKKSNKLPIDVSTIHNPYHDAPASPNTRCADLPLYDEPHISPWLKGNDYIRSYYRCGYTTKQCLKSIFAVHNETGNIWTHVIGVLVVLALGFHVLVQLQLPRSSDYGVFLLFELASLIMLGGSSVYHTLAAHHCEQVHNAALAIDYFGITAMIIGSFYPPVFYMFSCEKGIRLFYLTTVTLLGTLGIAGPFFSVLQ
ncbi:Haemolysin-III related, putative [Angomonas deanei]|uniref:Haemolysin-III related, putative n=1 Tax=Angomonas deanei TaxID=59799 RepID=A0A7G2C5E7_9TRYP|nr:Haemolysin-III related, putative [Angomonas deanei]